MGSIVTSLSGVDTRESTGWKLRRRGFGASASCRNEIGNGLKSIVLADLKVRKDRSASKLGARTAARRSTSGASNARAGMREERKSGKMKVMNSGVGKKSYDHEPTIGVSSEGSKSSDNANLDRRAEKMTEELRFLLHESLSDAKQTAATSSDEENSSRSVKKTFASDRRVRIGRRLHRRPDHASKLHEVCPSVEKLRGEASRGEAESESVTDTGGGDSTNAKRCLVRWGQGAVFISA
ncbi:MAG TPA: hypothetical protein DCP63_05195 [Bacteroidetes bacterium]|nr:hypothetical protein [Bacteroidota bacterium]